MSRKPPKKSDMGKSWMKPRRDSRQMISPEYHLIVSEGTKTEPKYFERIKETIDSKYRDRIHALPHEHGDRTARLRNLRDGRPDPSRTGEEPGVRHFIFRICKADLIRKSPGGSFEIFKYVLHRTSFVLLLSEKAASSGSLPFVLLRHVPAIPGEK